MASKLQALPSRQVCLFALEIQRTFCATSSLLLPRPNVPELAQRLASFLPSKLTTSADPDLVDLTEVPEQPKMIEASKLSYLDSRSCLQSALLPLAVAILVVPGATRSLQSVYRMWYLSDFSRFQSSRP